MDTRAVATECRLTQWAQAMKERVNNGESITDFCENRGVSRNTYFYWQRKLREAACVQLQEQPKHDIPNTQLLVPVFAEVMVTESATPSASTKSSPKRSLKSQIHMEVSGVRITTDSAYPTEKLAKLLRELTRS